MTKESLKLAENKVSKRFALERIDFETSDAGLRELIPDLRAVVVELMDTNEEVIYAALKEARIGIRAANGFYL